MIVKDEQNRTDQRLPAWRRRRRCTGLRRGNLKRVGIYLFLMANKYLANLLGIPFGTLRGLDSDGRRFLNSAPPKRIGADPMKQMSRCWLLP